MRILSLYSLVLLCFSRIALAHPVAFTHERREAQREHHDLVPRQYKAVTALENKYNIAGAVAASLVTLVSTGVVGLIATQHLACKSVAKQQEIMQKNWDLMHPDGFTPAGDQMRPASFDCNTQERRFKPLIPYENAANYY
ncbi:uncharacterized protein MEPE_00039 [Melanopsichium pennsylvanicum]|uniref:Uncharacterized protein n=1 Tax=Melanopsichium pennsylvanicum TaxID=63383 RepID=A0AAJ4XFB4_9BASI|nr:uncharacterized protein MEPE_00039 [Melanopsichium pennsylvanicum]